MNASFGIDHPLLATHDIDALRTRLIALGFNMTPVGQHPWGTSTSLAMFDGCLLEIMGVYDETLADECPAGTFRFGRHVAEHLAMREGIALSALHSTDSVADAQRAADAGFNVAGHLEFGRDVTLPDGTKDRTKTTLALLPDSQFPRLSFFLCQQHRPELIYVPEWLKHPNTVNGICGVNIVAPLQHQPDLQARFGRLYTDFERLLGGFQYQTPNGALRVMHVDAFEQEIGPLADDMREEDKPFIAGMDFTVGDLEVLMGYLQAAQVNPRVVENGISLTKPSLTANTNFRFFTKGYL